MSNCSSLRILKELKEWQLDEDDNTGIRLEQVGESLSEFCAVIKGPSDTPYYKGKFQLNVKLPFNYPFRPPKVRFSTRIWHPNISSVTGALCLDILNKNRWSPAMTLKTMLLSVQSLLADPKPDDPQDAVVAGQYLQELSEFTETARYWSQHFAKAAGNKLEEYEQKVTTVYQMGFGKDEALVALSHCHWNVDRAINKLCND